MEKDHLEKKISPAVIRRMPRYYHHLSELHELGVERISSGALGQRMGLTASQVRQDFNCFGGFGQQGYGYRVAELRDSIAAILCIDRDRTAVLIGVGNLGRSLIINFNFTKNGLRLVAAFDTNPALVGTEMAGVPICSCRDLERLMAEQKPDIAILCVPKLHGKAVAQRLIDCGIRGIWNFTGADLQLELPQVPIENVHFSESLMVLSYQIER